MICPTCEHIVTRVLIRRIDRMIGIVEDDTVISFTNVIRDHYVCLCSKCFCDLTAFIHFEEPTNEQNDGPTHNSPEWKNKVIDDVSAFLDGRIPKVERTTEFTPVAQWMVKYLNEKNIPFRLVTLGLGVKKITTDTEVCPKCCGTGRC